MRHPTAIIHPEAELDPTVQVGAYSIVEAGVRLGPGCVLAEHVILRTGSHLGEGCRVDAHAVIGGLPQDLRFDPSTPTGVRLGARVTVREGVTIHRATRADGFTEVGDGAFLMAYCHVAHDCRVGPSAILANNILMAGHVSIGAHAFIGGGAAIHQHTRIGESAMVSGMSRAARDVPPFCMVAERDELIGLNLVGLKRRGFSRESIRQLKDLFHQLFGGGASPGDAARQALDSGQPWEPAARELLNFCLQTKRGFAQRRQGRSAEADGDA